MEILMPERIEFHLGDVIRKLRNGKAMTVEELAEKAGVNKMTISAIERGASNYKRDTIEKIGTALDCPAEDLYVFALHQSMSPDERKQLRASYLRKELQTLEAEPVNEDVSGYVKDALPVIAEGDATPQPNLFWDNSGVASSDVEDRITRPHDVSDPKAYGVKVRGDSMAPAYRPGMIVVVSPSTPVTDGDEVYVQMLSGERLLKVARRVRGGWLLESYNPAHAARFVEQSEIGAMHVVLWARRSRKGERIIKNSDTP